MRFNTRNPIPSGDLRDLDDNARNIDTWANDKTKLSHPDRFGVERRTWHGIEQEAQLNIQQAIDAKNAAQEAAMISGFSKYADTLAQLESGIGTDYIEGDVVMVFEDESRGDTSSIYKVESGAAEFKLTFDKTRQDLLSFTGNISADAEWSDVPAHSDPAFDVQAKALADRAEWLKVNRFRLLTEFTSAKEAISEAVSGGFVIGVASDVTIKIPSDASTLQIAFNKVSPLTKQCKINVLIESGYRPTAGVVLERGDFSQFYVSSEDSAVYLDSSFTGRFISTIGCAAPVLNCFVVGTGSSAERCYSVINGYGRVLPDCGGQGFTGRILYGNGASIYAGQTIWKDFGDSIYGSAGSAIQLGEALVEGFIGTANGAVVASRGSAIEAQAITLKNCKMGFECKRAGSSINAHQAVIQNIEGFVARATRCASISIDSAQITEVVGAGLEALSGGKISFGEGGSMTASSGNAAVGVKATDGGGVSIGASTIENFGGYNIEARSGGVVSGEFPIIRGSGSHGVVAYRGGKVLIYGATVTGNSLDDVRVLSGGEVNIVNGTTTSSVTPGTPDVADTNANGFGGLNALLQGGRGIIYG